MLALVHLFFLMEVYSRRQRMHLWLVQILLVCLSSSPSL